jgi:hypothetical protein
LIEDPAIHRKSETKPCQYQLVIARYNEDISWSNGYPRLIFNKGERIEGLSENEQIMLPNVGREAHTYLTYIVSNYENLPECVLFCQGRIDDHLGSCSVESYVNPDYDFIANRFCYIKEWDATSGRLKHYGTWLEMLNQGKLKASPLTYVEWFEKVLHMPLGEATFYSPGAIFCVASRNIRKRHVGFYRKLLAHLTHHSNPEEAHYLERSWFYIFARKDMRVLALSR